MKILKLDDSGESFTRSIGKINNRDVYINQRLTIDSICSIWYNSLDQKAYLKKEDENITKFFQRIKHYTRERIAISLLIFIVATFLNLFNIFFLKAKMDISEHADPRCHADS